MSELYHYGVLGMKWGVRRYQPYSVVPRGSGKGGKEIGDARSQRKAFKELKKAYRSTERINDYNKRLNKRNEKVGKVIKKYVSNDELNELQSLKNERDSHTGLLDKASKEFHSNQELYNKHLNNVIKKAIKETNPKTKEERDLLIDGLKNGDAAQGSWDPFDDYVKSNSKLQASLKKETQNWIKANEKMEARSKEICDRVLGSHGTEYVNKISSKPPKGIMSTNWQSPTVSANYFLSVYLQNKQRK